MAAGEADRQWPTAGALEEELIGGAGPYYTGRRAAGLFCCAAGGHTMPQLAWLTHATKACLALVEDSSRESES